MLMFFFGILQWVLPALSSLLLLLMTVLMQKFLSPLEHLFVFVLRLGFVLVGTIDVRLQLGQQGIEEHLRSVVPLVCPINE